VAHGCQAGLRQAACDEVYHDRILRGTGSEGFYSTNRLGAFGSDLGAVACFFEPPWCRVSPSLKEDRKAWLLNAAADALRALGRLKEALAPMRAVTEMTVHLEDFKNAAVDVSNLSKLELTLGDVAGAVRDAEQSVTYADRSGDTFQRRTKRCTHGDALHQAGRRAEAETRFREAEQMQQEMQPDYPLLYALRGFQYCDLLLADAERAAWQLGLSLNSQPPTINLLESCRSVSLRAQTLKWMEDKPHAPVFAIALNHLTLGRAALYEAILSGSSPAASHSSVAEAVADLRRAKRSDYLPGALLTRAWLRFRAGAQTGPESAQEDLDEAWEIAERGPMKLHMADIHLHRARLFFREATYPWESPAADFAAARKLIEQCGYGRRKEELDDAEAALRQRYP
jgi:tetratricopeptide (TPR) repeat protein